MSDEFPTDVEGLDEETVALLNQIRARYKPDSETRILRDLSKLSMSESVEIMGILRTAAEFDKESPSQSNIVARQLFKVFHEKIGRVAPDILQLMEEEAALADAGKAARKASDEYLREKSKFGKPLVYWSSALLLYVAVSLIHPAFVLAIGAVMALWAFARSTLCRTFRAASYVRLADMLDGTKRKR